MATRHTVGTDLEYNIAEAMLVGEIDGITICAQAGSGGRSGAKEEGAEWFRLANNPFATGVKLSESHPGGPLPMTKYYLKTHEIHANWIRLIPFNPSEMNGRTGMAIHGRGRRGSDGCIVPSDFHIVQQLWDLCAKREKNGKPHPTLIVVAVGELDQYLYTV